MGGIGGGGVKVEVTETVQWSEDPKGREDGREIVRHTGRYDDISFNIKTTYRH